jgi:hypothetical protein
LLEFCVKILPVLQILFQSAQHIYEKREGSGSVSSAVLLTNGSGSWRPKNMRILRIRIPNNGIDTKKSLCYLSVELWAKSVRLQYRKAVGQRSNLEKLLVNIVSPDIEFNAKILLFMDL